MEKADFYCIPALSFRQILRRGRPNKWQFGMVKPHELDRTIVRSRIILHAN